MSEGVIRTSSPGLDVETLFLSVSFIRFQAEAQHKTLATFKTADAGSASLTLAGDERGWACPITGAFGGLSAEAPVGAGLVFQLVEAASVWLAAEAEATHCVMKLAPECFPDPNRPALENALFRNGWTLDQVDLNYHLPVIDPGAFSQGLGETKRQELRRLKASGAVVTRISTAEAAVVHEIISENHASRGFPMNMTWAQTHALAKAFPSHVSFHGVRRGDDILAGAICLKLSGKYTYVFNWGERPNCRKESPVTLLTEGLMSEAFSAGVEILDLGIATAGSIPNLGLISYKERLGCATSAKRTYRLDLDLVRR
jgi:hypothetical protein